jgi:GGDEF domain-containing protein
MEGSNVQSAASHPVEHAGAAVEVSNSGGAVLAEVTAETDDAQRPADEALYRAKRSGGNRICVEGLEADDAMNAIHGQLHPNDA